MTSLLPVLGVYASPRPRPNLAPGLAQSEAGFILFTGLAQFYVQTQPTPALGLIQYQAGTSLATGLA